MQKTDLQPFCSFSRDFIDEPDSVAGCIFQGFGHIFHGKCQVVDPGSFLFDKLPDGAFRIGTLQELNLGLSYPEESSPDLLVMNLLNGVALQSSTFS